MFLPFIGATFLTIKGDGNDGEPDARQKTEIGKKAKNGWNHKILYDLGLELRIFNSIYLKRSEAKVDLRGHLKNLQTYPVNQP